jgi:hypothetical protein
VIAAYVFRTDSKISTTCFKRSGRRGEVVLTAYILLGTTYRSRFSVGANAEFLPKFHDALQASHAALQILISKFRPKVAPPHVNINISPMPPSQG